MNDKLFAPGKKLLSLYITAGYPDLEATHQLLHALEATGKVDFVEVGIPYSDPVADGATIQEVSAKALAQGSTVETTFASLERFRQEGGTMPLYLMGHYNSMLQFGEEEFCRAAVKVGVRGFIIPDLPPAVYASEYAGLYKELGLEHVFLITPQTSLRRVQYLDSLSNGFLYAVTSSAVTGGSLSVDEATRKYLTSLASMKLRNPLVAGFGIDSRHTVEQVWEAVDGAIIASAFLRYLTTQKRKITYHELVRDFVERIRR